MEQQPKPKFNKSLKAPKRLCRPDVGSISFKRPVKLVANKPEQSSTNIDSFQLYTRV